MAQRCTCGLIELPPCSRNLEMKTKCVINMARRLMSKFLDESWSMRFMNSKSSAGICDYNFRNILLSRFAVIHLSMVQIREIILHEIAHALVGWRNNHNKIWKKMSLRIGASGQTKYTFHLSCPTFILFCGCCERERFVKRKKVERYKFCQMCKQKFRYKYMDYCSKK